MYSTRLVLLGCDHTLHMHRMLMTPESIVSFERTEAFEWARRRGNRKTIIPTLQPFKLRYAELLADFGREDLAREYLLSVRSCIGLGGSEDGNKSSAAAPMSGNFSGGAAIMQDPKFIDSLRKLDDRICKSTGVKERSSWEINDVTKGGTSASALVGSMFESAKYLLGGKKSEKKADVPQPPSVSSDGLPKEKQCDAIIPQLIEDEVEETTPREPELNLLQHPVVELMKKPEATTMADNGMAAAESSAPNPGARFIPATPSFEQLATTSVAETMPKSPPVENLLSNPFSFNGDMTTGTGGLTLGGGDDNDDQQQGPPSSAPPMLFGDNKKDEPITEPNEEKAKQTIVSTPVQAAKKDDKKKAPASAPASGLRKMFGSRVAKLLGRDPDSNATVADVGEEMQAYYDDKLKRWIFPGDDPAEVAKPLAPPPIIPKKTDAAPATPAPADDSAASNDPLAALMAPPPSRGRGMSSNKKKGTPMSSRYADPLASMGNVMPSTSSAFGSKSVPPESPMIMKPPTFAVFQPKPMTSENTASSSGPSKDEE